jgi:hypothetical protein
MAERHFDRVIVEHGAAYALPEGTYVHYREPAGGDVLDAVLVAARQVAMAIDPDCYVVVADGEIKHWGLKKSSAGRP